MKTIIIIPARFKSTRFPGKPLAVLNGQAAILWTLKAALNVSNTDEVYVATDSLLIKDTVESIGGKVIMTSEFCNNGTERVAEAAKHLKLEDEDIIINFQGDAPLTPSWFVEKIIAEIKSNKNADMVTPILKCDEESYLRFTNDRLNGRVGATTSVSDLSGKALYFSKEVVPFLPNPKFLKYTSVFHHVGIYGYRMAALKQYPDFKIGPLEQAEQLEQLRFLENGKRVYNIEVESHGYQFWELNNPEDIEIIEKMMTENEKLRVS